MESQSHKVIMIGKFDEYLLDVFKKRIAYVLKQYINNRGRSDEELSIVRDILDGFSYLKQ
jgi:hypothetical protein